MGRQAKQGHGNAKARKDLLGEVCDTIADLDGPGTATAKTGLLKLKAQLLGVDAPPPPARRKFRATGDHLVDTLRQMDGLLEVARERGSVDSAGRLLKLRAKIVSEIRERDEARREAERANLPPEAIVEELIQACLSLPLPLRLQVARAIGAEAQSG